MDIIGNDIPERANETSGIYWDSYCQSISIYPEPIRKAILQRDSTAKRYQAYLLEHINEI